MVPCARFKQLEQERPQGGLAAAGLPTSPSVSPLEIEADAIHRVDGVGLRKSRHPS